jgi:hypothetical protein
VRVRDKDKGKDMKNKKGHGEQRTRSMPNTLDPCLVHDHLPKISVQTRCPGRERKREREREETKGSRVLSFADSSGQDIYNIGSRCNIGSRYNIGSRMNLATGGPIRLCSQWKHVEELEIFPGVVLKFEASCTLPANPRFEFDLGGSINAAAP